MEKTKEAALASDAILRHVRVRKEDSAYIYAILESHEGIASYSTLDSPPGAAYRDLELQVPCSFQPEVEDLLTRLKDLVFDLDAERK